LSTRAHAIIQTRAAMATLGSILRIWVWRRADVGAWHDRLQKILSLFVPPELAIQFPDRRAESGELSPVPCALRVKTRGMNRWTLPKS
jgi:hypothetical protein